MMKRLIVVLLCLSLFSVETFAQNIFAKEGEDILHARLGNMQFLGDDGGAWGTSFGFTIDGRFTASVGLAVQMDDDFEKEIIDGRSLTLTADYLILKQKKGKSFISAGPFIEYQKSDLSGEYHHWIKTGINIHREIKVLDDLVLHPTFQFTYNSIDASTRSFSLLDSYFSYGFTLGIKAKGKFIAPEYIIHGAQGRIFNLLFGSFF